MTKVNKCFFCYFSREKLGVSQWIEIEQIAEGYGLITGKPVSDISYKVLRKLTRIDLSHLFLKIDNQESQLLKKSRIRA